MSKTLRKKAIKISKLGYATDLFKDKTTDGDSIYLAQNPELEGCMAQGETPEEALTYLEEVRVDYIEHLLEHNLQIPFPKSITTSSTVKKEDIVQKEINGVTFPGFEDYLTQAVQPSGREKLYSIPSNTRA